MIFDTHSHCYWKNLEPHIDEIIVKMQENGVTKSVQIGCDIPTSHKAISLAHRFPEVFYATVGLHPETAQHHGEWRADMQYIFQNFLKNFSQENNFEEIFQNEKIEKPSHNFNIFLDCINKQNSDFWQKIFEKNNILKNFEKMILENPQKIVAIGETGLDFHYIDGTNDGKNCADLTCLSDKAKWQIENQKFFWLAQWKLASKYNFPLVIHTRDAREATVDFMKKFAINRVVMHCYSEDPTMARELLDFSSEIYFSFSGIVTYKNSLEIQETAKMLPLDRILVETDSPFLSPQPVRGTVNNPANTRWNLEKICELRNENSEEIEEKIFENSLRFYGLK